MDFDALANQHKDAVYRHMIRVCGNREDAEDVLVEALLKAYRNLGQLRESAAFRSWLGAIARRICWQLKERQALQPLLQLSVLDEQGEQLPSLEDPADSRIAAQQLKQLLFAAMDTLSPLERQVYKLRDLDELPGEVVAKNLNISLAAMKSRLHRARSRVREAVDQGLATGHRDQEKSWKSPSII